MQRDVPGIDHAFLAMDVEEGVEVVWNEVQFSERKDLKAQEVSWCLKLSINITLIINNISNRVQNFKLCTVYINAVQNHSQIYVKKIKFTNCKYYLFIIYYYYI